MPTEVEMRVAFGSWRAAHEQPDDDEREDDGGRRADKIERKRQREIIALAKAMGMDKRRRDADRGSRDQEPADRPRGWAAPARITAYRSRRRQAGWRRAIHRSCATSSRGRGLETFRSTAPPR